MLEIATRLDIEEIPDRYQPCLMICGNLKNQKKVIVVAEHQVVLEATSITGG